jgi:antitoxin component YwqK of YwqJK toxin-antitoxin module
MSEIYNNFCGVVRTYYDNKKTKLCKEYFTMNGKIEGVYKIYHPYGQLWIEVNYIDGMENGIYKAYHDNGQLYKEVNYIDGLKQGIFKSYWDNGQLYEEVNYIDGKKV